MIPRGMRVPVAVWQPCELLYTCYLLTDFSTPQVPERCGCVCVQDSPSSKLLFAKDVPTYRAWLSEFYVSVRDSPAVSDDDMRERMLDMSRVRRQGSRVVSVLDSGAEGPGFKSQSRRCRETVSGKLFTPIVPLFTKQQNR